MKNFLVDLCMVALLLFMINGVLGDYNIQKTMFAQNISQFEADVAAKEPISSDFGTTSDDQENTVSLVVKVISDCCIKIIETLVLIISNIISTLL